MKKTFYLLALSGMALFAACDPVEDDYSNNTSGVAGADQIKATVTVETQNGRNVNMVHVNADGNAVPICVSNGVNTVYSPIADLLLFGTGENSVFIRAQNPDGSVVTKEEKVNVDEMFYEVPVQYDLLTNSSTKTWTWDPDLNGGSWGNCGYLTGDGEGFATQGNNTWFSCPPADLAGQLDYSSTGKPTGEESPDAYMEWSLNGTKIETFAPDGTLIRSGTFSIENWDKKVVDVENWSIGTLNTSAEAILFPWLINQHGVAPTTFEVMLLDKDKMVLVSQNYTNPAENAWAEATFWRFKAK